MENLLDDRLSRDESNVLTEQALDDLHATSGWMKFLAVIGFITGGLCAFGAFGLMMASASSYSRYTRNLTMVTMLLYVTLAGFIIAISVRMFQAASGFGDFRFTNDAQMLETAFRRNKQMWMLIGIYTITIIVLYLFLILTVLSSARSLSRMF